MTRILMFLISLGAVGCRDVDYMARCESACKEHGGADYVEIGHYGNWCQCCDSTDSLPMFQFTALGMERVDWQGVEDRAAKRRAEARIIESPTRCHK